MKERLLLGGGFPPRIASKDCNFFVGSVGNRDIGIHSLIQRKTSFFKKGPSGQIMTTSPDPTPNGGL